MRGGAGIADGIVVRGHGVASGRTPDARFPHGTIALQLPVFRTRGLDIAGLLGAAPFMGTINLDLAPAVPRVVRPEIALDDVAWCAAVAHENFWFFRARLDHGGTCHPALIYMPDPATKPEHLQPPGVIESIAPPIPGLAAGDRARVTADPRFIRFH